MDYCAKNPSYMLGRIRRHRTLCSGHRGLGLAGKLPSEEGRPRPFLARATKMQDLIQRRSLGNQCSNSHR